MKQDQSRAIGFDFIRSFAILFVYLAHILNKQCDNSIVLLIGKSISPGLTMSVLGFISGYLLSLRYEVVDTRFYVKRFSRIYSSLFICLTTISVFHFLFLDYDLLNQHSIIHFLGLSFFLELLQVQNKSSIGAGLWFVTIILCLYLLLPIITSFIIHRNHKIHLILMVVASLLGNEVMYGTASAWNVIIGFIIGCYIAVHFSIDKLSCAPFFIYGILTVFILILCALSKVGILPDIIRNFILPLYSIIAVPFLYKLGKRSCNIPYFRKCTIWISSISYEIYILHFYFTNKYFSDLFPYVDSMYYQILLSFLIVLPLATILAKMSRGVSQYFCGYLSSDS